MENKEDYCCVIPNKLYFGNKILAKDETRLRKLGIKSIIDLINYENSSQEIKHSKDFNFLHLSIEDVPTNNADWAEEGSTFIEEQIKNNNPVYVHCSQGISRSSTLIMHYLMTREKQNLKTAFFKLKDLRNIIDPTTGFMKSLSNLDEKLFGKKSFTIEEYSLFCLKESFPDIDESEIKDIYEQNKKFYSLNNDIYLKESIDKKCEPIGYKTIDDLLKKYGKENMIDRQGCSLHHPFD
jgi:protein-tyrosine phosphatase